MPIHTSFVYQMREIVTPGARCCADDRMAYDSGKRLLLSVLLKGLAYAIRQDDQSAAQRYLRRLHLAAEEIAVDEQVQDALKTLLSIGGLWVEAAKIYRDENRQQMLELIVRVIDLLTL